MKTEITWVTPWECAPPHRITHPEKYYELREQFAKTNRWGADQPALLGYKFLPNEKIQLLSGSHRWQAALDGGLDFIPVAMVPYAYLVGIWGTDEWLDLIKNPPKVP
jgi:hypothetical protein